ncbi:MAG: hypothetical protein M0P66_14255 [Salinivirgaceae bacterium]|nr:hypothetical protein [Salinivirgaceae bacterium]
MTTTLTILDNAEIDNNTKVAFTYVWHIIGIDNFIFGIALLFMTFCKNMSRVKFVAWLIIAILAMRWVIITYFTISNNNGNFKQLIPDTVAIFVIIILLFLGIKIRDTNSNE